MKFRILLRKGIRKKAWCKNLLIFYPLYFNYTSHNFLQSLFLFCSLSFLASAVYVFNDYFDRSSDALHPVKKKRIQVVEEFSISDVATCIVILISACMIFFIPLFSWKLLLLFSSYLSLNALYTLYLKYIKWVDAFCLSLFLFFRIASGCVILNAFLSWLETSLLLILFLALAILKRRIELMFFIQNKISLVGFGRPYTKDDLRI